MILPPRISTGQTIGIIAPAGPVASKDKLQRGLARFGDRFRFRLAASLTSERDPNVPSYLAASDDQRAEELDRMLGDPDVRAIILARGGYGLMRILSRLDPDRLRADPKPIVGFSDTTALLSWAHAAGVRGIHGPMILQLADLKESDVVSLVTLLTDPRAPGERPWTLTSTNHGTIRGPLVPANVTLASMLVGTPWQLPLDGAIAILEEVGEKPYELDRYLTQLQLTGAFAKLAAMIVGDLTRCIDPNPPLGVDPPDAALRVFLERAASAGKSAAVGAPIGHGDRNEAVPFGARAELDLDRGVLSIEEGAVS
ncbi:MAG TPA: LD-carboxypeptidase [Kofleriaceae bacterium]